MTDHIRKLAVFIAAAAACFGQTSYTITPITAPSGYQFGDLVWVSEDGKTGFGGAGQTGTFVSQCMTYQNGTTTILPTPGLPCSPAGANTGKYIAALSEDAQGARTVASFVNGSDTVLTPPSGVVFPNAVSAGVNALGEVATTLVCPAPAGYAHGSSIQCAYTISNSGTFTRLPDKGYGAGATAINASGDVAGWVGQAGADPNNFPVGTHAVVWLHTGTVVDLSNLATQSIGVPTSINSKGQVTMQNRTGIFSGSSFLYDGVGKITQIPVANASLVWALSINDNGEVVGEYYSQSNDDLQHPFYYFNGTTVDLNSVVTNLNGAILTVPTYIANSGEILSSVVYSTSPQSGPAYTGSVQYLLTPVVATPPIAATPAALSFAYQTVGNPPAAQSIEVTATGSSAVSFTAAASSTGNWLSVTPSSGVTPASLSVSVSGAGLAAGVYSGQIVLTSGTAGNPQTAIPVTMTVINTQTLSIDTTPLNFTYTYGGSNPAPQTLQLTSALGNTQVPFTIQPQSPYFDQWLTVTPTSGTTPATLTVSPLVTPANFTPLPADSLSQSNWQVAVGAQFVIVAGTAGSAQTTVPVVLNVTSNVSVAPTSLAFTYQIGGSLPAAQSLQVGLLGNASPAFTVSCATFVGNWLSATPSSGTAPASVSVSVSPAGLAAGTYNGVIVVADLNLQVTLTVTASGQAAAPAISSVENAASYVSGTSSNTWITILGSNLSTTTRPWAASDFVGNSLPTSLDGVSVTVNGHAAYPSYISPAQLNVLAPQDTTTGLVQVVVTNAQGSSKSFTVTKSDPMPAFFTFASQYVAATHANAVSVGAPGLISGATFTPAAPGEVIQVFGTGFGATATSVPVGQVLTAAALLSAPVTVTVGGKPATVAYQGMTANGLDQLNITIPAGLPDGDAAIVASVSGVSTQSKLYVTVKN